MPARPVVAFCVPLRAGERLEGVGGKARSLLRLADAGLPVPPAFAVSSGLFAALRRGGPPLPADLTAPGALEAIAQAARALRSAPWPAGFQDELAGALSALPRGRFSVRSSAETEDDAGALAAGLFTSRVGVAREEVEAALREVLAAALSPGVLAYRGARGQSTASWAIAALIHPYVDGQASGTAATDGTAAVVEARGTVTPGLRRALESALDTLAARQGPVEVEWVATGDAPLFLQLRPYRPGARRRPASAGDDWRWDAAHNPLPLSPAQAGLVAVVDERCEVPFAQKVVGGYLFYGGRGEGPRASGLGPRGAERRSAREAFVELEEAAKERLGEPEALEEALETFAAIYEPLFGVVQPAARAAREELAALVREAGLEPAAVLPGLLASVASAATKRAETAERIGSAVTETERERAREDYLSAFGDESAVWDVAEPTWRERPMAIPSRPPRAGGREDRGELAGTVRDRLPPGDRARWDQVLARAREAAAVAEDDDALYARAQAHVRRALLAEGERMVAAGVLDRGDQVFWLPLEVVRRGARGEGLPGRDAAARMVAAARAEYDRARTETPSLEAAVDTGEGVIRGRPGSPGACIGRVRRWPLVAEDEEPPVVVARTILPTELPLIDAAALVVETGGVLDHVAAQARERGIPAVVGAAGALEALQDGDRVLVDGDAGVVAKLAE
jgi:phosphohistidine swiveling domain-containing protein